MLNIETDICYSLFMLAPTTSLANPLIRLADRDHSTTGRLQGQNCTCHHRGNIVSTIFNRVTQIWSM